MSWAMGADGHNRQTLSSSQQFEYLDIDGLGLIYQIVFVMDYGLVDNSSKYLQFSHLLLVSVLILHSDVFPQLAFVVGFPEVISKAA